MFDFGPQIPRYELAGAEPTLRKLIYKYYKEHFNEEESLRLTEEYIVQFVKQYREI